MQPIATIAIVFLEFVSVMSVFYIVYFIWLRWKSGETEHEPLVVDQILVSASLLFFTLVGVVLTTAHFLADAGLLREAVAVLVAGFIAGGLIYFRLLRPRWSDDRIQYAVLLWATLWILIVFFLFVAWRWRDLKLDENTLQIINNGAQILGIVIAAAMIVLTNLVNAKQQNTTAQHKIYQTLELQSVQLFQWECEHPEYSRMLWISKAPPKDPLKLHLLRLYICQTLNLFEMAVRFRREKIVAPEVFGSWVIWMWDLCTSPVFQKLWGGDGGIWSNYVVEFREIMSRGIEIAASSGSERVRREKFFQFVGDRLKCNKVQGWMTNAPATARLAR